MGYLGNDLQVAYSTYKNIDDISGSFNGSTTSFSLLVGGVAPVPLPLNSQQCLISVGGVIQRPDDTGAEGFRLSSGNIVFSSAPSTGEDFFGVILAGADYVNVGANFPSGSAAVPSITFDSDLDTGIYNSGANQVSITTAGTERLRITSAGLVGIGTSSPSSLLHLVSSGQPAITVADDGGRKVELKAPDSSANPGFVGTTTNHDLLIQAGTTAGGLNVMRFNTAGAERVRITDTGRVGIGTTAPGQLLEIHGASNPAALVKNTTSNVQAYFYASATAGIFGTPTVHPLVFNVENLEKARIDTSGRLLVGTSSARANFFNTTQSANIQLEGTAGTALMSLVSNHNDSGGNSALVLGKTRGTTVGSTTVVQSGDILGRITFQGSDGTEFVQAADITAEVDGTPGANDMPGRLVFSTTPDGQSSPIARMTINNAGNVTLSGANRSLQIGDSGAAYLYFTSTSGGSEISHNNNYLQLLTSQVSGVLVRAGTGGVSLAVNATAWASASDERLKTDLDPIASGLEKVGSLRAVTGRYETDDLKIRRSFLIAQDVQAVLPEAVDDSNSDELGLRYTEVIPLLVAALKESKERIERLEAEMAEVKAQLS